MPSTIVDSYSTLATGYPQQIRVFRNPRGLQYYYAVISTGLYLYLYKSSDGQTWTLVDYLGFANEVASLDWYDDGTQLIVYVACGLYSVSILFEVYYRRLRIPDDVSDPIIGVRQIAVTDNYQGVPVIKRDRNGYVHIAFMRQRLVSIKGVDYVYAEPYIVGTTTTNPDDTPTWTSPINIDVHPDIAFQSLGARCSLVMFGGTGDIGGVVYASRNSAGVIIIRGRDVVSFNGTTYSLGTRTTIISSGVSISATLVVALRAVEDNQRYAHLLTERTLTNAKVQSLKASAFNTVESWDSPVTVDASNNACTLHRLSLSIDRSVTPNILYSFYVFDTVGTNILRYRSSPTDAVSWSSEVTVVDDTVALVELNSCYERTVNGVQIVYMRSVSPYTARYYELPVVAPPPPSGAPAVHSPYWLAVLRLT